MNTIYKYELGITNNIEIHKDAKFLSLQMQGGNPCAWYLVDTSKPKTALSIACYGTGHEVTHKMGQYLNTVQFPNGLVFHFFEVVM